MSDKQDSKRRELIKKCVTKRIHSQARSRIDTSDIVSQAELSLWLSGHDPCESEYPEAEPPLIRQVARRTLAKEMRFQGQLKRDYHRELSPEETQTDANQVDDETISADVIAQRRELFAQINTAILAMGDPYWKIYQLRYFGDTSVMEICKEVGLTRRKVLTHLKQLHQHVKKILRNDP